MDWSKGYKRESKASWDNIAEAIHDTVTMGEIVKVYAPSPPPRHNRIPCPFHNGKDYNLSFMPHGYKCFVCGATGDAIAFVKDLLGLSTRADAMRRINQDLGLRLPLDGEVDARFSETAINRRKEAQERERIRQEWWAQYHALMDEWIECDKVKRTAEPMSDEWCNAVKRLEYIGYLLDGLPPEPR